MTNSVTLCHKKYIGGSEVLQYSSDAPGKGQDSRSNGTMSDVNGVFIVKELCLYQSTTTTNNERGKLSILSDMKYLFSAHAYTIFHGLPNCTHYQ